METRHGDNDGSDIFWPGYVDAVTNLVLNLLFLLTIMTVAVFMFALELGRASHSGQDKAPVASTKQDTAAVPKAVIDPAKENIALRREIARLLKLTQRVPPAGQSDKPGQAVHRGQAEQPGQAVYRGQAEQPGQAVYRGQAEQPGQAVHRGQAEQPGQAVYRGQAEQPGQAVHRGQAEQLGQAVHRGQAEQPGQAVHRGQAEQPGQAVYRGQAEQPGQAEQTRQLGGLLETVDVTSSVAKPLNGLDKTLASDHEILVHFADEAVGFKQEEHDRLLETLKPVVARGKASIYVEVPAGFSEAKRMGYYRAMAVRNLLIELKMPLKNIGVKEVEGKNNANASIVRVR